jgi:hypothetical protein
MTQISGSDVDVITGTEPWPHVTQAGGQIAVHGSTVVVVYLDSREVTPAPSKSMGVSVSTDGGASFTRISPSPFTNNGAIPPPAEPFVVYNRKLGLFFAGGLSEARGAPGLGLWTSPDGLTWTPDTGPTGSLSNVFRASMAVDNTPTSPYYGRMYLCYDDFNRSAIFCVHSDNGTAWTAVLIREGLLGGLRVAVAPDGTVLWALMGENLGGLGKNQNVVVWSTDGGFNFNGPIAQTGQYARPGDATSGSSTYFQPIWRNRETGDLAIGSGGVAIEAYVAHGADTDGGDIYLQRSANNGLSWGTPVRIDGDDTGHAQWMPSISATGSQFLIAWYDRRNTTNGVNYERWGTVSTDGGVTWSPPGRISDILIPQPEQPDLSIDPLYSGFYMRGAAENGIFYDAWTDGRVILVDNSGTPHAQQDIFLDRIALAPTAAAVSAFAGRRTSRGIVLSWRAGDVRLLGYHLWRARKRITKHLIPAMATTVDGRYRYLDRQPRHRATLYRLQLVGLDGSTRFVSQLRISASR